MIFFDDYGYPSDQTGDGGDSAVRASLLAMCKSPFMGTFMLRKYEIKPGLFVRHPKQVPWNNYKNLTRDQTICLVAGLKATGNWRAVSRMFYSRAKCFFFSQSTERDYPGTKKYPWPHTMTGGDPVDEGKLRLFDGPDILMPNHVACMILAGKVKLAYLFLPIGYLFHFILLFLHSMDAGCEQNQMICECYTLGTLKVFNKLNHGWEEDSLKYWSERGEVEYHKLLVALVNS